MEKVTFTDQTGEKLEMFVLEKTKLSGNDYLLVCDQPEGDAQALILKDVTSLVAKDGGAVKEASYSIVSDDEELSAVAALFESLLDDVSFTMEEDE